MKRSKSRQRSARPAYYCSSGRTGGCSSMPEPPQKRTVGPGSSSTKVAWSEMSLAPSSMHSSSLSRRPQINPPRLCNERGNRCSLLVHVYPPNVRFRPKADLRYPYFFELSAAAALSCAARSAACWASVTGVATALALPVHGFIATQKPV